jgi:hypothetical protein
MAAVVPALIPGAMIKAIVSMLFSRREGSVAVFAGELA